MLLKLSIQAEYDKVSNTEMFSDGDHLPTAGADGGWLCGQLHCLHTQEERCPVPGQQHQPPDVPPHVHQLCSTLCKVGLKSGNAIVTFHSVFLGSSTTLQDE